MYLLSASDGTSPRIHAVFYCTVSEGNERETETRSDWHHVGCSRQELHPSHTGCAYSTAISTLGSPAPGTLESWSVQVLEGGALGRCC